MNSNSHSSSISALGKKDLALHTFNNFSTFCIQPFFSTCTFFTIPTFESILFSYNLISINIRLFMFLNFFSLNFISKEKCNYSALKVFLRCFSLKPVYCQIVPYLIIPVPYCYAFTLLTVGYLSFQFPSLSFPCILNFISFLSSRLHFCIFAFCPIS